MRTFKNSQLHWYHHLLLILAIVSMSSASFAFRDYDDTLRPRRDATKPMDNIALRLEGQHLSKTCPPLIEQKVKDIPPRVCSYYKVTSQATVLKVRAGCDGSPCCEPATVDCSFEQKDRLFYVRLLLRPDPRLPGSPMTCQWEGCPYRDYFGLTGYSENRPVLDACVNQCAVAVACKRDCTGPPSPPPPPPPGPVMGGS